VITKLLEKNKIKEEIDVVLLSNPSFLSDITKAINFSIKKIQ
jgi:hypothetical protein